MSDPRIRAEFVGAVVDNLCVWISAWACDVIALAAVHGGCDGHFHFSRKPCLQATSKYIFFNEDDITYKGMVLGSFSHDF